MLIILGVTILLHEYVELTWEFIRSYGFFILGLFGVIRGVSLTPRRGIFFSSLLMFSGLYFILAQWGLYELERGLTISSFILILSLACYMDYFLGRRRWEGALFGFVFLGIGVLFLLEYLQMLPPDLFATLVDKYWPLVLIIIGLGFLFHDILQRRHQNSRHLQTPDS
ncbi:MAG: hypothetical protein D6748_15835 [Calditrichaeota bacterium]|nr:MAG: hypothetical protein D6748_15835 [Calditrichota bacterium]